MAQHLVNLPLGVILPRKGKDDRLWYIKLNDHGNDAFHLLSDVQINFKEQVEAHIFQQEPST